MAIFRTKGRYCKHWEQMLPSANSHRQDEVVFTPQPDLLTRDTPSPLDRLIEVERFGADVPLDLLDDVEKLKLSLREAGLSRRSADVVIMRAVGGRTYAEVAEELGYADRGAAHHAYQDAVDKLRALEGDKWEKLLGRKLPK